MPMADMPQQVDQDSIERLSAQAQPTTHVDSVAAVDVEWLLEQAEHTISSMGRSTSGALSDVRPFELVEFTGAAPGAKGVESDSIHDVELDLAIEFGRTRMNLEDALRLRTGSVVPLDKQATDPVDIIVNGRLVAKGEVLALNDRFCVRVAELVADNSGL
jgi:flagellar motor switch protein FliN